MERQIGSVDLVRWQGRRIAPHQRVRSRFIALALSFALMGMAALVLGVYSHLPVGLSLLRAALIILLAGVAAYGLRLLTAAVSARHEPRGVRTYRR